LKLKIISLFLIFLLIFSIFINVPNTKALLTGIEYWEDFEDDAVGEMPSEGSWLSGYTEYPADVYCDGSDLYFKHNARIGYLNLSYDGDQQVDWYYQQFKVYTDEVLLVIFNAYNEVGDTFSDFMRYRIQGSENPVIMPTIQFWNYSSNAYESTGFELDHNPTQELGLTVRFNFNNLSIYWLTQQITGTYYTWDDWIEYSGDPANDTYYFMNRNFFFEDMRLTQLEMSASLNVSGCAKIRDLKLRVNDTTPFEFDTTGLLKFGDVYASGTRVMLEDSPTCPNQASEHTIIETQRRVNCNYKLRHFVFAMGSSFFITLNGDINDLFLQINGIYVGQPTSVLQISEDRYNIYWINVNISINDYPLFEIKSAVDNPPILNKWDFFFTENDIDNDGYIDFMAHSYEPYYDGKYIYEYGVGVQCDYDLIYECWFEEIAPPVYEEYDYNLIVSPNTVDLYKPVEITYTCPIDVINKLVINNGTADVYNETTGITGLQTGTYIYYPITSGTHNISIWDDTNSETEIYETLTVNDVSYTFVIFTQPNPSKPDNYFNIYYIYNTTVYSGVITINDERYNILETSNEFLSVIENVVIYIEGTYPVNLYMNVSGSLLQRASSIHRVHIDTLNILYITYKCSNCPTYTDYYDGDTILIESNTDFRFLGSHNFVGQKVYISVFNTNLYVGDKSEFDVRMRIQTNGDYVAELILEHEDTKLVLTDIHFVIVDEVELPTLEWWDIMQNVHPFLKAIVGTIITLTFTLLPMFIALGFRSKTKINIPSMVYALSGSIGIVLSIYAGLFDFWVLFFIIAVGIIVIVLFFIKGGGLK